MKFNRTARGPSLHWVLARCDRNVTSAILDVKKNSGRKHMIGKQDEQGSVYRSKMFLQTLSPHEKMYVKSSCLGWTIWIRTSFTNCESVVRYQEPGGDRLKPSSPQDVSCRKLNKVPILKFIEIIICVTISVLIQSKYFTQYVCVVCYSLICKYDENIHILYPYIYP